MTVVGSVSYEVLGEINPEKFDKSIDTPLNRAAARAGDRFGTVLGKGIGAALRPFAARAGDDAGAELSRNARAHGVSLGRTLGAGLAAGLGFGSVSVGFESLSRGLEASVAAADELEKAGTRARDTFGAATSEVEAFAKSKANLLLTQSQALEGASVYGDILRGVGVAAEPAAKTSTALVGVAENLAAIKGLQVDTVLTGLRGALQGTSRNVRALGLDLSVGRVTAEAYALGLARPVRDAAAIERAQTAVAAATANLSKVQREHGTGTLAAAVAQDKLGKAQDALTKASGGHQQALSQEVLLQARAALILRETQSAAGGAARNQDSLAVASQRLHKQLGDVSAELGTKLIPYEIEAAKKFSALIDEFHAGKGAGGELRTVFETAGKSAHQLGEVWDFLRARTEEGVYGFAVASRGVLDVLGVMASVSDKLFHTHLHKDIDVAITKMRDLQSEIEQSRAGATIPITVVVTTKTAANANPALHAKGFIGPTVAEGLSASGVAGPYSPLQTGAKAVADQLHATQVRMRDDAAKTAKAQQYASDQLAAYQDRQRAAVQAAEDAARARGEATTKALQDQADGIKRQVDGLTTYAQKIKDFRASVVGLAQQFTALTSLAPDASRATAAGLVGSLQSRVLAETLFQKNLTSLATRHLDKGVLAELAQAGPEQRALASALAAGTDTQIQQLNAAERASRARAASLGTAATDQQFGAGTVQRTNAELARLNAQVTALNKLIAAQPALIGKAVDQAGKNAKTRTTTGTRTAVAR